jgi:DNA-directed RNA polymerase subunit RPC12/RpoP
VSYDVECPYCGSKEDINHDDGYGYEEDKKHEQQCSECGKNFTFTTSISFHYDAEKADCLNGAEHRMEKVCSTSSDIFPDWKRCKDCEHEVRGEYKPPLEDA